MKLQFKSFLLFSIKLFDVPDGVHMKPRNWTLTKANLHLLHSTIVYGFPLLHGCNKAVISYRGNVKSFFPGRMNKQ